ncbi:hypothetical protein [Bradyrhizobium centrolobii]|uniref:hypothetical protein n=1 Tax=Bradyrhizobium centrolobii TaxID=1505087 RepID=UPI000A4AA26D
MLKKAGALSAGLTIVALAGAAMVTLGTSPAQAVVYCKTVGVPKGCVVRPTAAVVVAPAAPVAAAAVATPGVGAPGVGVRADEPRRSRQPRRRALSRFLLYLAPLAGRGRIRAKLEFG